MKLSNTTHIMKKKGDKMVKLKGFDNIELKNEKIMNIGSIARINQIIEILEGLEPTKEITECIELLEEIKKIEGW
jgi:hypothetical protein